MAGEAAAGAGGRPRSSGAASRPPHSLQNRSAGSADAPQEEQARRSGALQLTQNFHSCRLSAPQLEQTIVISGVSLAQTRMTRQSDSAAASRSGAASASSQGPSMRTTRSFMSRGALSGRAARIVNRCPSQDLKHAAHQGRGISRRGDWLGVQGGHAVRERRDSERAERRAGASQTGHHEVLGCLCSGGVAGHRSDEVVADHGPASLGSRAVTVASVRCRARARFAESVAAAQLVDGRADSHLRPSLPLAEGAFGLSCAGGGVDGAAGERSVLSQPRGFAGSAPICSAAPSPRASAAGSRR